MNLKIGSYNSSLSLIPLIALSYMNIPYIYGGKTPIAGLDCSGLVCELLQIIGVIGTNEELNAQGIYNKFKHSSIDSEIGIGALAFYGGNNLEISHVAMFIDNHLVIEAGHGTPETKSVEDATKRDAKVRVRTFNYRKDLVAVLRPKYEDFGFHN